MKKAPRFYVIITMITLLSVLLPCSAFAAENQSSQTLPTRIVGARNLSLQAKKSSVKHKTGVYKNSGKWKYYKNGKFKKSTGIAKRMSDGKWVYIYKGIFKKATGVAKRIDIGKWYYVKNGEFKKSTGLAKRLTDKKWVYVKKGIFTNFTGVVKKIGTSKTYYVKKGILNKTFNGIAKDANGVKYRVTKGVAKKITNKPASVPESGKDAEKENPEETEADTKTVWKSGSKMQFGSYEQNNIPSDGKEAITWTVLSIDDTSALLLSDYGLDCLPYNNTYAEVTWETCSLREWLNGDFFETAFSETEKNRILSTKISTPENSEYHADGGNDTIDKVFLLSLNEADALFQVNKDRIVKPTAYTASKSPYINTTDGTCWWWLRTPGDIHSIAAGIDHKGALNYLGYCVDATCNVVRPAIRISIE